MLCTIVSGMKKERKKKITAKKKLCSILVCSLVVPGGCCRMVVFSSSLLSRITFSSCFSVCFTNYALHVYAICMVSRSTHWCLASCISSTFVIEFTSIFGIVRVSSRYVLLALTQFSVYFLFILFDFLFIYFFRFFHSRLCCSLTAFTVFVHGFLCSHCHSVGNFNKMYTDIDTNSISLSPTQL